MRTSDAISNTSPSQESLLLVRPFTDFRQLLRPWLTSRSDLHRCPFGHKARSPQVRTHSFPARPPNLRHRPLVTRASRSLARSPWSAPPLSGSCPSAHSFAPRFLPTLGHPHAVALRFARCDQLATGLPPVRVRPCWAHKLKAPRFLGALRI
jgi:hypothetical protein